MEIHSSWTHLMTTSLSQLKLTWIWLSVLEWILLVFKQCLSHAQDCYFLGGRGEGGEFTDASHAQCHTEVPHPPSNGESTFTCFSRLDTKARSLISSSSSLSLLLTSTYSSKLSAYRWNLTFAGATLSNNTSEKACRKRRVIPWPLLPSGKRWCAWFHCRSLEYLSF